MFFNRCSDDYDYIKNHQVTYISKNVSGRYLSLAKY
jgi:hypothetical protein